MSEPRLAYALDGPADAPVLVLSSSLGTTRDMWSPQGPALSGQWRLLRVDHPGHGESPVWDGQVTVERIGLAVLELLDRLDLQRVSFCGLSLGGAIGQSVAAHAPARIDRLILCSTSARFATREAYLQRAATVREQGTAVVAGAVIERWFTARFRDQQPLVVARYRSMVEATPAQGYAACCEAVAEFDGRPDLASITAPTLVIAGDEDPATPSEQARALRDGIAGARLEVIAEAAHLVNVEQPEAVSRAILTHLRGESNDGG
jgi:3-oxoadipate enol-lactonase